ncbi:S-layer homology domain-containing protein [Caldicellulosiruptor naganoensis]|uniref:S-layer homology domain-containing protein n=1 Tax=Caldicellulosiruptor naganoensis TaxID=29324 RepID=A0ABY7BJB1_9FIRM|nr:S-layer homology domain-containing protein [Caldicellulosiruptor naganoensis]WAM31967.1 S-layer homology domain-containing protein [Caldicellulosiruptor naganoensis]
MNAVISSDKYVVLVKAGARTYPRVEIDSSALANLKGKGIKNIGVKYPNVSINIDVYSQKIDNINVTVADVEKPSIKVIESNIIKNIDDYTILKIVKAQNVKVLANNDSDTSVTYYYSIKLDSPLEEGTVPYLLVDNKWIPIKNYVIKDDYAIIKTNKSGTIAFVKIDKKFGDTEVDNSKIAELISLGIVTGDSEGNLKLDKPVTRAETFSVLAKALDIDPHVYVGGFVDVPRNAWYAGYAEALRKLGIIEGYSNKLYPTANVTREQLAKIVVNVVQRFAKLDTTDNVSISDLNKVSGWAKDFVLKAVAAGLMSVNEDKFFRPQDFATR